MMPRFRSAFVASLGTIASAAIGTPAQSMFDRAMVIDREGETHIGAIEAIDFAAGTVVMDNRSIEAAAVLNAASSISENATLATELSPPDSYSTSRLHRIAEARNLGILVTTAGDRFPGKLGKASSESRVAWAHPHFDGLEFPIESISVLAINQIDELVASAQTPVEDRLVLQNRDTMEGLVLDLQPQQMEFENSSGAQIILETERVRAIEFANPRETVPSEPRLWLDEGTVITSEGQLDLMSTDTIMINTFEVPTVLIRAIAFDASEIVPLIDVRLLKRESLGSFRLLPDFVVTAHPDDGPTLPATALSLRDIHLAGPQRLVFQAPEKARRLIFAASIPAAADYNTDCSIIVRNALGSELSRVSLSTAQPGPVNVNVTIDGGSEFVIELDEGANGPIGDAVTLSRPMVLQ
ncbi:MAG: hypothetical protein AAGB34_02835 [Planctomycetota bacterium]